MGGGGEGGQEAGILCLRLSPCWAFDRGKRPGVGTFDFHRQKPGINSEEVTKSVPQGFLKVMLLEKGMKFLFVLITLRWLDTVFQDQYLPSLSINYFAIKKVLEKLPSQLY